MGDDAELWIESGGDPTTLIPDNYWDDEYDDYNDSSKRKKNTMVFIDAESVSADHCSGIMGQCNPVGEIFEVRYYARQNDPATLAWKDKAKAYNIKPILMYGEPAHNKIDNKIVKDIRRILETNREWSASSADHLFFLWYAVLSFMSRVPVLKPFMTRRFLALSFLRFFSTIALPPSEI